MPYRLYSAKKSLSKTLIKPAIKLDIVAFMRQYRLVKQYIIEDYITENGIVPFQEWLTQIKDKRHRIKVGLRLERTERGNLGDWKPIKNSDGICELRLTDGKGYRIYYRIVKEKIILLLTGSTKEDQKKQITRAKMYYENYKRRTSNA